MGVAEVLAGMRAQLPGSVKFIFQPAEEGPPAGEEGGAELMIKEGVLEDPKPDAIFGLHVFPRPVGTVAYRPGGFLASADSFKVVVKGRQTHGAMPWAGVDPIVVAAQIVMGFQTIASRQLDVTATPSIVTVGAIHGGVRNNIIPDEVEMIGTLRTFDAAVRTQIHEKVKRTAETIAASAGATAEVTITPGYPVTVNDAGLTERMIPTLNRVAGADKLALSNPITGAEDFSYFQQRIPGLFVGLGVAPPDDPSKAAPNHSPLFYADERALTVGVRVLANLTVDFLERTPLKK
jgi:amidohydrolase